MRFMQTESVLQTKNRSGPAKNRFSVALLWVPCVRSSSYNFMPIFSKVYRYFCCGLKMCMWFGYNSQINFCHFFRILNVVIVSLCF